MRVAEKQAQGLAGVGAAAAAVVVGVAVAVAVAVAVVLPCQRQRLAHPLDFAAARSTAVPSCPKTPLQRTASPG